MQDIYEEMEIEGILREDLKDAIVHGICVSNLAYHLAKELELAEEICYDVAVAGLLHDIGKIQLSSYLYGRNEDVLQIDEMRYVRMHCKLSYQVLRKHEYKDNICKAVLLHHENYDGSGYPQNLRGEDIPIEARILRVCDVFSALISNRPYRRAFDVDTAVELMIDEVKNFDIKIFLAFQRLIHTDILKQTLEDIHYSE